MEQKRIVFTLGTIEAFQTNTLINFQQKLTELKSHKHGEYQNTQQNILSFQPRKNQNLQISKLNPLSQMPLYTKKSKFIKKQQKAKEGQVGQHKKEKQTILFKYFKRRLFLNPTYGFLFFIEDMIQNKLEIGIKNDKCFDLMKIFDWQMEASHNLQLSKDTFYTTVALTKKFFAKETNQMFSPKMIQIQLASILSLASKIQSNKVNYPQAISMVCGFNKTDIIDGQIFVIKSINFKIPLINIQTQIMGVCLKWHEYICLNGSQLKLDIKKIEFGKSFQLLNWSSNGKNNFTNICSIVDFIALKLYKKIEFQNLKSLQSVITKALFMLVNYQARQFFPVKASQKSYVALVFQNFLKISYEFDNQQFIGWITDLIKNEEKLRLVQFTSKQFNIKQYQQMKESFLSQEITRTSSILYLTQLDFFKQSYTNVLLY